MAVEEGLGMGLATVEQPLAGLARGSSRCPGSVAGSRGLQGRGSRWSLEQRAGRPCGPICSATTPASGPQTLVNAWMYVATHREQIEAQIRENEEASWPPATPTRTSGSR